MASYTVVSAKHATLTGTTQDQVTLGPVPNMHRVAIINRGTTDIGVRVSWGGTAPTTISAVLEDDSQLVQAGGFINVNMPQANSGTCIVKLLGNGNAYSVVMEQL